MHSLANTVHRGAQTDRHTFILTCKQKDEMATLHNPPHVLLYMIHKVLVVMATGLERKCLNDPLICFFLFVQ